jgi:predicted DNA-binding protein (MmcQ/YjbR family)
MSIDWIRKYCLSLPHSTETVQWGNDLVFKIRAKMYAVVALEPSAVCLSFKCTPEEFAELIERPSIIPAPYLARYFWVGLESHDALPVTELKRLLRDSYEMVKTNLPKKVLAGLGSAQKPGRKK